MNQEGTFLQSLPWGNIKKEFGWNYHLFVSPRLLILTRKIGKLFPFAYLPWGLSEVSSYPQARSLLQDAVGRLPQRPFILRWDVPHLFSSLEECRKEEKSLASAGFHKARDVQASSTVMLDLRKSKDSLFSEMKSKTRYNIRLAEKKEVVVRSIEYKNLHLWYQLHRHTATRQNISVRPLRYYQRIMELLPCRCTIVFHEKDALAGILVLYWNKIATYLFGGSSDIKKNYMAGYYLQWEALQYAQEQGMYFYDFFGISRRDNPSDSMHGLYKFKTGFGGTIYHRPGSWDLDVRPATSFFLRMGERFLKRR